MFPASSPRKSRWRRRTSPRPIAFMNVNTPDELERARGLAIRLG